MDTRTTAQIVRDEIEEMLNRCVAAGLTREAATVEYRFRAAVDAMHESSRIEKDREAPFLAHVKRAFCCQRVGDTAGHKAASEAWLLAKHGVRIGDVVEVFGWKQPREILLDEFFIEWTNFRDDYEDGFLWFSGPTSFSDKGRVPSRQGAPLDTVIRVRERAGDKLRRTFPERFCAPVSAT